MSNSKQFGNYVCAFVGYNSRSSEIYKEINTYVGKSKIVNGRYERPNKHYKGKELFRWEGGCYSEIQASANESLLMNQNHQLVTSVGLEHPHLSHQIISMNQISAPYEKGADELNILELRNQFSPNETYADFIKYAVECILHPYFDVVQSCLDKCLMETIEETITQSLKLVPLNHYE